MSGINATKTGEKMLLSDELSLGSLIELQSRLEAAGLRTPLRMTACPALGWRGGIRFARRKCVKQKR